VLFSALPNPTLLRAELGRLFRWLKAKGVTAVVTAERGDGRLTRQGLEEYVADCVIVLDHRVADQVSTHRLRIVKYRGTAHGTNGYPFLIGRDGLTLLPVTGIQPAYAASTGRISTGVERLDAMLEGRGYYRGSTVLISGSAGTGKTSLGAAFAEAAGRRRSPARISSRRRGDSTRSSVKPVWRGSPNHRSRSSNACRITPAIAITRSGASYPPARRSTPSNAPSICASIQPCDIGGCV